MVIEERRMLLEPRALPNFVETDSIRDTTDRALTYLAVGFPVHLRGAAGTGKTTLAMHIAAKLGRPEVTIVTETREPGVDLLDARDGIVVTAEFPGVREEQINVPVAAGGIAVLAVGRDRRYPECVLMLSPVTAWSLTSSDRNGIVEIRCPTAWVGHDASGN